jgi:hypothetical protein
MNEMNEVSSTTEYFNDLVEYLGAYIIELEKLRKKERTPPATIEALKVLCDHFGLEVTSKRSLSATQSRFDHLHHY